MILIQPRKEIIVPLRGSMQMRGFFRVQLINKFSGKCRWDSGFFPNRILNSGRNHVAQQSNWLAYCHVGTDGTTPSANDTGLLGLVATTNTVQVTTSGAQSSPPYYGWKRRTYRFAIGAGHGGQNLSEAGVGYSAVGSSLICRALIVDPDTQQTTTVTPLADELLDVTYELRYYPPLTDTLQTVVLDGNTYDVITRAAEVTNSTIWGNNIGTTIGEYSLFDTDWQAFDGTLGTILQRPNGVSSNTTSTLPFNKAYSNNSYTRGMQVNVPPTLWNLGAGIRSIAIRTQAGGFQSQFSNQTGGSTIPKTDQYTMVMVWNMSWAAANAAGRWTMIAASDSTTPSTAEWNTNLAGTTLRIAWTDYDTLNQKQYLNTESGSVFRITDTVDTSKWIEYTVSGAYTEYASWTEYTVSQTGIGNGGPTTTNLCDIRNLTY